MTVWAFAYHLYRLIAVLYNPRKFVVLCPDYFSYTEGKNSLVWKIVWSTAYSIFVPCGLKIADATSSTMYYLTSHKAWNYERALKRRLVAGIILLGASECQETKIHKTWSLCQPQIALRQSYQHLKASGTSHCQFSSSETHTVHSQKSWHSFAGRSLVLHSLVSCIALQLPSHLWSSSSTVCDVSRMRQRATNLAFGTKIDYIHPGLFLTLVQRLKINVK